MADFICLSCKHVFDTPNQINEQHHYGEGTTTEIFYTCPCCGGDFEELKTCTECLRDFPTCEMYYNRCWQCYVNTCVTGKEV